MASRATPSFLSMWHAQCTQMPEAAALVFRDGQLNSKEVLAMTAAAALFLQKQGIAPGSVLVIDSADLAIVVPTLFAAAILGAEIATVRPDGEPAVAPSHVISTTGHTVEGARGIAMTAEALSPANYPVTDRIAILSQGVEQPAARPWIAMAGDLGPDTVRLSQLDLLVRAEKLEEDWPVAPDRVALVFPSLTVPSAILRVLSVLGAGGALVETGTWDFWHKAEVDIVCADVVMTPVLLALGRSDAALPVLDLLGPSVTEGAVAELTERFGVVLGRVEMAEVGALWQTDMPDGTGIAPPIGRSAQAKLRMSIRPAPSVKSDVFGYLTIHVDGDGDGDGMTWESDMIVHGALSHDGLQPLIQLSARTLTRGEETRDFSWLDACLLATDGIVEAVAFPSPKTGSDELLAFAVFAEGRDRYQIVNQVNFLIADILGDAWKIDKIRPIDAVPRGVDGKPDRIACAGLILAASARDPLQT